MERVSALVVEALIAVRSDGKELDASAVDELGQRTDHALAFHLPFVAAARREGQQRRAPVAVDDHAHVPPETTGVPPLILALHRRRFYRGRGWRDSSRVVVCFPFSFGRRAPNRRPIFQKTRAIPGAIPVSGGLGVGSRADDDSVRRDVRKGAGVHSRVQASGLRRAASDRRYPEGRGLAARGYRRDLLHSSRHRPRQPAEGCQPHRAHPRPGSHRRAR